MTAIIVEDAQVNEEQGFVDIVIRLSALATAPVTVSYDTDSLTATTSEYGNSTGTVTFALGSAIGPARLRIHQLWAIAYGIRSEWQFRGNQSGQWRSGYAIWDADGAACRGGFFDLAPSSSR